MRWPLRLRDFGLPERMQLMWAIPLLFLLSLKHVSPLNLEAQYEKSMGLFHHGRLEECEIEANRGYEGSQGARELGWATRFLLLKAEAILARGEARETLVLLESDKLQNADTDQSVERLSILGAAYARLHRLDEATLALGSARSLCEKGTTRACGGVLRAWGMLAMEQGNPYLAQRYFLEGLSFARSRGDRWLEANALLNLGFSALQDERFDESLDWSRAAYDESIELGDENRAQGALGNMGWAYIGLGDIDRALALFREAEMHAKRIGNIGAELTWVTTGGYAYQDLGDLRSADDSYSRALTLAKWIDSKEDVITSLELLSQIAIDSGDLDRSEGYISQASPLLRTSGNHLDELDILLAQGRIAAARRESKQAETIFATVMHDPASQTSMRLGAGHELARLYEAEGNPSAAERTYKTTLATFEVARDELKKEDSKLPFLANATRIYDDYISFLVSHGKVEEALAAADSSRAQTLEQGLGIGVGRDTCRGNPHGSALARSTGATLLFYWLGEKQSYLWTITSKGTKLFTLPSQLEIAARVKNYRSVLLGMNDPIEAENEDGRALYQMLVAPAANMIHPNAHVIVLADGELSKLNFETLIVPGPHPHYWIEDVTPLSAPSLRMMANAKPARMSGSKLLLVGNAISPGPDYPELPMAATEMRLVEARFPRSNATVFARAQANAATYLASNPEQFTYIHFVTHAVASSTDPLDSAIILSRSAGGGDGFKLYARQILTRPIHAQLVTISACYGSGMRSYAGEGLVGLSWAFLHAGAHNVIGALWEVSDDSTPHLMDALYQGLQSGQTPPVALRNAKLTLLHSEVNFRKPFFWASFQLYSGL